MAIKVPPAPLPSAGKRAAPVPSKADIKAVGKNAADSNNRMNFASILDGAHDDKSRLLRNKLARMVPSRTTHGATDIGEQLHDHLLTQLGAADLLLAQPAVQQNAPPTPGTQASDHHQDHKKRKTDLVALVTIPAPASGALATAHAATHHASTDIRATVQPASAARARGDVTLNQKAGLMHASASGKVRAGASSGRSPDSAPVAPRATPPGSGQFAASTKPPGTRLMAILAKADAKASIGARKVSADASTNGGFSLAALAGTLTHTGTATAASVATAVTTTLAPTLQAPIGSTAWQQQLGSQLVRLAQRGSHKMELHVHPRQLGPLQISLQLSQGGAQAHFMAAHAQVRDAVQQAIPQLREALANQGIALGEAMVGQQQQQAQQQSMWAGSGQSRSSFGSGHGEPEAIDATHAPRTIHIPLHGSGVDLYA